MQLNRVFIVFFSLVIAAYVSMQIDARTYEVISLFLASYFLLNFIDSIGKTYNVLDIPVLLGLFQLLLMPMVVYRVYNNEYFVQDLYYDMSVSEEMYYSFMLPAILMMIAGMKLQLKRGNWQTNSIQRALQSSKEYLKGRSNLGMLLMIVGFVSGFLEIFIPGELKYVAYLFGKLLFVGVFYILFSDFKSKQIYLAAGIGALLLQALVQGMFGELIFTLLLGALLYLLGKKISFGTKMVIAIVGATFVLLLQSIKAEYRAVAWYGKGAEEQTNTQAFFSLLGKRIQDPSMFFDRYTMFPTVNRFNQGMIQGKVMAYVPDQRPYAGGSTIFTSLAASFIPRLLWPDKPMAGGHWNMEFFTGFIVEGYSMNVGPFGESYGNFGATGGILFMFLYGLFFNVAIFALLRLSKKRPTLILWFPILFLNSIQVETDILMTVNSLIKNSIFIWFCYWAAHRFLRLKL
ncbi:MAG TPA: hypothetical protein PKE63_00155 [Lacibacter sp.]|nr:hypothetical protein [Lacibacter sp.]